MHKLTINRARLSFRLVPVTPLLVKAGDDGSSLLHPERPDLTCVRTHHGSLGETVYVPGSSLKGVVRSSAERILRSLELPCCDPMDQKSDCHKKASKRGDDIARAGGEGPHPMGEVHRMLCLACRTFGSQAIAGRASFSDAYPTKETAARANATERRSGVSIDRTTGGPARGKLFEMELVTGGELETAIHLANYELWQLALVGVVLFDLHEGFVRLGSAKTRGLGRAEVRLDELVVDQREEGSVRGVAALAADLRAPYGLLEAEHAFAAGETEPGALGMRSRWKGDEAVRGALEAAIEASWKALLARRGAG